MQSGEVRLATRLSHCAGEVQRAHGFVRVQRVSGRWSKQTKGVIDVLDGRVDVGVDVDVDRGIA